jgi:hypothetical protein
MNHTPPSATAAPSPAPGRGNARRASAPRWTYWFGWGVLATMALAAVGLLRLIWVAAEVRTVRHEFFTTPGHWHTQFQFNAGPLLLGTARLVARLAPIDPDLPDALSAVRRVSVGLYQDRSPASALTAANESLHERLEQRLRAEGWERSVTVRDAAREVDVYTRTQGAIAQPREVEICVVVRDRGRLVVASLQARPEPLLALASRHPWPLMAQR